MQFAEMTDRQWNAIRPHLPRPAVAGRPGADDRTTINAIMFVPVTGCRRVDLPAPYGSKSSAHRRLQSPQQKGVCKRILRCAIKIAHRPGQDRPAGDICGFVINTRQKRGDKNGYDGFRRILGAKLHVAAGQNGLPVSIRAGPADSHDGTRFADVVECPGFCRR
jgi:transposase